MRKNGEVLITKEAVNVPDGYYEVGDAVEWDLIISNFTDEDVIIALFDESPDAFAGGISWVGSDTGVVAGSSGFTTASGTELDEDITVVAGGGEVTYRISGVLTESDTVQVSNLVQWDDVTDGAPAIANHTNYVAACPVLVRNSDGNVSPCPGEVSLASFFSSGTSESERAFRQGAIDLANEGVNIYSLVYAVQELLAAAGLDFQVPPRSDD